MHEAICEYAQGVIEVIFVDDQGIPCDILRGESVHIAPVGTDESVNLSDTPRLRSFKEHMLNHMTHTAPCQLPFMGGAGLDIGHDGDQRGSVDFLQENGQAVIEDFSGERGSVFKKGTIPLFVGFRRGGGCGQKGKEK